MHQGLRNVANERPPGISSNATFLARVLARPLATPSADYGGMFTSDAADVEFITIPEWCRRVGCSLDAGYRAARCNQIAGLFRIGRLMRVNWQAFVASTATPAGERP